MLGYMTTLPTDSAATPSQAKDVVRRLVREVMNEGRLDAIDEVYAPHLAAAAKGWITPFRAAFPDVLMEIVDLIEEGDKVVGRFLCSGTHRGEWDGKPPTGRRFTNVDEVYIFRISNGRIHEAWGLEDTLSRMRQLEL